MEEKKDAYKVLVGKPEGKIPLEIPRCRRVDSIKIDFKESARDAIDYLDLAQDRDRWRALVSTIMNLWFP
jgi:hypothetical protein